MGHFLFVRPGPPDEDLRAKYNIPHRAEHGRRVCEHVGEDGHSCPHFTVLRPDRDGKRRCYFHHGDTALLAGADADFDDTMRIIAQAPVGHEEECSIYYYRDNFAYIKANARRLDTIIEVGCYLGGLSAIFAQAARRFGLRYYIIEYNLQYLLYTYERLARTDPGCLPNVRLYHGTFADFVQTCREPLSRRSIYLEIDGAHTYDGALADLTASHAIRRGIHSIACHDYHLRSADPKHDLFVDRAIHSVFGVDAVLRFVGFNTGDWIGDPATDPSGNQLYNKPYCFEGAIVNLAENAYCFDRIPHRPPLRLLLKAQARQTANWVANKMREWRDERSAAPVYEPRLRT
ncbi:MAG: class I SAM-dependent methyltransferase, partial [Candidatus Sumerlaeota bacterium]|nr:class I SAM-dependent methyltransferase [Candidatus Sumerlaeota bacterium]